MNGTSTPFPKETVTSRFGRLLEWGQLYFSGLARAMESARKAELTPLCKAGDNGLPQGDAAVIAGHLSVGKNLEAAAFQ